MLVVSMFSFTGAWHTLPRTALDKWRVAIERAVMSPVGGRSRLLLWAGFLGPWLDPEFNMDYHQL